MATRLLLSLKIASLLSNLPAAEVVGDDLLYGVAGAELGIDAVAAADDGPLGLDGCGAVIPLDVQLPRHLVELCLAELVDLVPPAQQLQAGIGVPG